MAASTSVPTQSVLLAVVTVCVLITLSPGCSQSIPTAPHGVLSTIHQKSLALAAERALDQAGVTAEGFGKSTVHLAFSEVHESDLGKQHVARTVADRFRSVSAGLVEAQGDAQLRVECQVLLAGVDIANGAAFGFSWLDTKAEVQLRLKYNQGGSPIEKHGSGNAVYHQLWWLGIGPSEKLK